MTRMSRFLQRYEAHFTLGGYVNQNCRIWGSEDPQVIEESPLHSEKVTVWCALWSEDMIRPYFFQKRRHHER